MMATTEPAAYAEPALMLTHWFCSLASQPRCNGINMLRHQGMQDLTRTYYHNQRMLFHCKLARVDVEGEAA